MILKKSVVAGLAFLLFVFSGRFLSKKNNQPVTPQVAGITSNQPTSNKDIVLKSSGIKDGYNYWLFENTKYPCGKSGNHQFLVLQKGASNDQRHLNVRFKGGAAGFFLNDGVTYFPSQGLTSILYVDKEVTEMFATALDDGLAKLVRARSDWRIMVPSYCSHDFYIGTGQFNQIDNFARWGYPAAKAAIDFTQSKFPTDVIVTSGTSAGASGAFFHGYNRPNVVGIVMDSNADDLLSMRNNCAKGIWPYTKEWACQCDGKICADTLAERIGFKIGTNEPYLMVKKGLVNKPVYLIWNQYDQTWNGQNAHLQFDNLMQALKTYNPGGKSVGKMVCVTNPATNKPCFVHSPTKYDTPETTAVFNWMLSLVP